MKNTIPRFRLLVPGTILASLVFGVLVRRLAAQPPSPGVDLYRRYCANCHGHDGRGGRGPDLTTETPEGSDAHIARTISKGVPEAGMPAFEGDLAEADIQQLVGYLRSLRPANSALPASGDPERGRDLFWTKGNCGRCHMVAARGGRLGPDLTRIGARRSPASLKESVINPSASISDGYLGVQIVPRKGPTIFGTVKNEDDFTIQIFDTTENFRSFRKADLAQVKILDRSLMPRPSLTPAEVDDVVAYLSRLREGE